MRSPSTLHTLRAAFSYFYMRNFILNTFVPAVLTGYFFFQGITVLRGPDPGNYSEAMVAFLRVFLSVFIAPIVFFD